MMISTLQNSITFVFHPLVFAGIFLDCVTRVYCSCWQACCRQQQSMCYKDFLSFSIWYGMSNFLGEDLRIMLRELIVWETDPNKRKPNFSILCYSWVLRFELRGEDCSWSLCWSSRSLWSDLYFMQPPMPSNWDLNVVLLFWCSVLWWICQLHSCASSSRSPWWKQCHMLTFCLAMKRLVVICFNTSNNIFC